MELAINIKWIISVMFLSTTNRGSPQLVASAESLVTDAERSNRRVTCLLHIISDVSTISILRAFIACAAAVQTAVLILFGPSCLGHYTVGRCRGVLPRTNAGCVVGQ